MTASPFTPFVIVLTGVSYLIVLGWFVSLWTEPKPPDDERWPT